MLFVSTGLSCQCVMCLKSRCCISVSGTRPRCMEIDGTGVREREQEQNTFPAYLPLACSLRLLPPTLGFSVRVPQTQCASPSLSLSLLLMLSPLYLWCALSLYPALSQKGRFSVTSCSFMWSSLLLIVSLMFFLIFFFFYYRFSPLNQISVLPMSQLISRLWMLPRCTQDRGNGRELLRLPSVHLFLKSTHFGLVQALSTMEGFCCSGWLI